MKNKADIIGEIRGMITECDDNQWNRLKAILYDSGYKIH